MFLSRVIFPRIVTRCPKPAVCVCTRSCRARHFWRPSVKHVKYVCKGVPILCVGLHFCSLSYLAGGGGCDGGFRSWAAVARVSRVCGGMKAAQTHYPCVCVVLLYECQECNVIPQNKRVGDGKYYGLLFSLYPISAPVTILGEAWAMYCIAAFDADADKTAIWVTLGNGRPLA